MAAIISHAKRWKQIHQVVLLTTSEEKQPETKLREDGRTALPNQNETTFPPGSTYLLARKSIERVHEIFFQDFSPCSVVAQAFRREGVLGDFAKKKRINVLLTDEAGVETR